MILVAMLWFRYFIVLLFLLLTAKILIITYRLVTKEWPASIGYLLGVVEWRVEAKKIASLAVGALIVSIIQTVLSK